MARPRGPFDPPPPSFMAMAVPAGSVIAGSLVTLLPVIASVPLLPPFGFMMLLGWRLARMEALPVWSPLALGLFDDLFSGQPFGFAMLCWAMTFVIIDMVDQRLVARDFWQDWLIVGGATAIYLLFGRLVAAPLPAYVDMFVVAQIAASVMLYPVVAQMVGWLDQRWVRV